MHEAAAACVGSAAAVHPASLAAIRSFTDDLPLLAGGWIRFTIDQTLIPAAGQRVGAMTVAFTAPEPAASRPLVIGTSSWRVLTTLASIWVRFATLKS